MATKPTGGEHIDTLDPDISACLGRAVASHERLPTKLLWTIVGFARATGHPDEAEALLDAIERRDGVTVRLLEERARLAFSRRDVASALAFLTARYERSPSATALIAIARLHLESGALDEAERISEDLSAEQGHLATVRQLAADVAWAAGQYELARTYFLGLLDDRPEHPGSLLALAQIALDEGDRESAAAFFRRSMVEEEALTASQRATAANVAARLDETELAARLREEADAAHRARARNLLREINAALDELPASTATLQQDSERVGPAPRVHTVAKGARPRREHAAQLHDAQGTITPDDPRVVQVLRDDFGHEHLRPGQSAVITKVLEGRDVLAIMPTGAGKSLTFQLPAMLDDRTTVVISPLIALMKDQVESLPEPVRAKTALINSTLSATEMRQRLAELGHGRIKLLYVAPERLRNYGFLRALREAGVSRVVIDEAHCISMWGHDFRPDYLFIPRALAELGQPPVLALTATATPDMVEQISGGLGRGLEVVRTSVFRPNLRYEVHHLDHREAKLERVVQICRSERGAGIVYVSSRRDTESIATLLRQRGISSVPYHAGLDPETRSKHQDLFMSGQVRVVVATVAFGMGVDKSDVRFIVHLVPPRSLEAYAQESGRAGRDGKPSRCVLLVSPHDRRHLVTVARRDEIDLDALRKVYGQLMRHAQGPWVIIDPAALRPAADSPDDEPDPRVALGILEQAALIHRHPDAPASYELRRIPLPLDDEWEPELAAAWERIERALPASWAARGACGVMTAELSAATNMAPVEIDRVLQANPALSVREGPRFVCLHMNNVTGNATQKLQALLDRARQDATDRIDQVMAYANGSRCRHAALAAHLGERLPDCGTACDVCTGTADSAQGKATARAARAALTPQDALTVLEAVRSLPYPMGRLGLVRLLIGSVETHPRLHDHAAFGALSGLSRSKVESLIDRLVDEGFLDRDMDGEYRLISLTRKGSSAGLVDLQAFDERAISADPDLGPAESRLYQQLSEWRRNKAAEEAVPPYVVASNNTLRRIAVSRPSTRTALLAVPGIGPKNVEKYGSEILAVIGGGVASATNKR